MNSSIEVLLAALKRSLAFQAAYDLVFKRAEQSNDYTEPLLHGRQRQRRALAEE